MIISEKQAYNLGLIDNPRSKYNVSKNKQDRTCQSGHIHNSQKECEYCEKLRLMQRNGYIDRYDVEVRFELQPAFWSLPGKRVDPIGYRADFVVYHNGIIKQEGVHEIIDVKGMKTQVFRIKWKMLQYSLRKSTREYILTLA